MPAFSSPWFNIIHFPVTDFTADEGIENANILSDVNTFISENFMKFVTGVKPIDEFDAFVEEVMGMKIDRVIANYENALERYNYRSS